MSDWRQWVGRVQEQEDRLDPARSNVLLAALGKDGAVAEDDPLPPLHHWLHFWEPRTPAQTGADGHPARGGFLPPIPLPRRMWAGGELEFLQLLHFGEAVTRRSTVSAIDRKEGRSGELIFVTVRHELHGRTGLAIRERQDLVYRASSTAVAALPEAVRDPAWEAVFDPDPVLLFRYSALTMNSHRIHYDAPYAQAEEGYPALVVQGPLQATMLADHAQSRLGGALGTFAFRGLTAAYVGLPLGLASESGEDGLALWTAQGGQRCMAATAR